MKLCELSPKSKYVREMANIKNLDINLPETVSQTPSHTDTTPDFLFLNGNFTPSVTRGKCTKYF